VNELKEFSMVMIVGYSKYFSALGWIKRTSIINVDVMYLGGESKSFNFNLFVGMKKWNFMNIPEVKCHHKNTYFEEQKISCQMFVSNMVRSSVESKSRALPKLAVRNSPHPSWCKRDKTCLWWTQSKSYNVYTMSI
jgi:hypothetical protein